MDKPVETNDNEKPKEPLFKDHAEGAWYLQSATKNFQLGGWLVLVFVGLTVTFLEVGQHGFWQ